MMQERLKQELELLQRYYQDVEFIEAGGWVRLPRYSLPKPWNPPEAPIVFQLPNGYPGSAPYGFYAPSNVTFNGAKPNNASPAPNQPPFQGNWLLFSWAAENWRPTADISSGSNLWGWCRSFRDRFKEGP